MLKWIHPMKVKKKLPFVNFFLSMILVSIVSLAFLGGLYYILNTPLQKSTDPFIKGPVTKPPKTLRLDLDQPDQDFLSYSSSIIVSGKTGPAKEVLISTDTNDLVIKSKPDGSFSTVLDLDEGLNRITAVVFDSTGEFRSTERSVYYSKEKL